MTKYITRQELADQRGCNIRTVDRWIAQRNLPIYKFGQLTRIKVSDLEAAEESCRVEAAGTPLAPQTNEKAA